jgi:predicted nuclease with TOPRIM domain
VTENKEVTERWNEAERKRNELACQVYELRYTNWDLTDSLKKAKADVTTLTKQYHQKVQGLGERIGKLQTKVNHWIGETKRIRKEKTALESKCRQYEDDKTSFRDKVETLEEKIDLCTAC